MHGTSVEVIREWFSWQTVLNSIISIALLSYLFDFFNTLPERDTFFDFSHPVETIFKLVYLGAVIFFVYYSLLGWFNETRFYIDTVKVTVKNKPLPFFGNKSINPIDVLQIYTNEKETLRRFEGLVPTYQLMAILKDGKHIKLLRGLNTKRDAQQIKREIKRFF